MKRLPASLVCVTWLGIAQAGAQQISLEDILLLTERGVSDETVLVFLETREMDSIPDAEDIDRLLAAGVSEEVIRYLLRQTATHPVPSYSYPTTLYVERYPPYYYTPYYSGFSVFPGHSSFPHAWFRHHHGGAHHTPLHHRVVHHPGHDDHGTLPHTVHRGLEHNEVTGTVHVGALNAGHSAGHTGRHTGNEHSVNHSTGSPGHVGGNSKAHRGQHTTARGDQHSVGHSSRNTAHRGNHSSGHSGGHGGAH